MWSKYNYKFLENHSWTEHENLSKLRFSLKKKKKETDEWKKKVTCSGLLPVASQAGEKTDSRSFF